MRVAVCGAGYVGLASALSMAHIGHEIRVLDWDAARIELLRGGMDPLGEPLVTDLLRRHRIDFTADPALAYRGADVVLIAVGTPTTDTGSADLSQLDAAVETLTVAARPCTVLVRSTVPVGTGDRLRSGPLRRFGVVSNPEFLREGHALADSLRPDRIVAGGDPESEAAIVELYRPIMVGSFAAIGDVAPRAEPVPLLWMDRRSAELAKYAANAFLATKLSFVNEMANVAASVGADIRSVVRVVGSDARIGPAFLRPGIGWGGSCFPKDTRALEAFSAENGYEFTLLRAVIGQNNAQLHRFHRSIRTEVRRSSGRIALLGLAFKAGTSDMRESPALALAELLLADGWSVRAFDPAVRAGAKGLPTGVDVVGSIEAAADDADAIVIATEWPAFADADFASLATRMRGDIVLDGRCIVDARRVTAAGLRYAGICTPARAD